MHPEFLVLAVWSSMEECNGIGAIIFMLSTLLYAGYFMKFMIFSIFRAVQWSSFVDGQNGKGGRENRKGGKGDGLAKARIIYHSSSEAI